MSSTHNPGRVAGLLYLSLLGAPLRLIYIPNTLFVTGNATATANNIAAHELLFRLGIVGDLLTGTMAIFLTLALYRLLKGVDHDVAALLLVRGADFLSVFDKPQRDALAMLFLRLHHGGVVANEIFWGLWLFPFGLLVYRSRFLPRILGVWLIINCFAYLAVSFTGLLFPQYEARVFNSTFPAMLGEPAIMLWLLIKGAKPQPLGAVASSLAAV